MDGHVTSELLLSCLSSLKEVEIFESEKPISKERGDEGTMSPPPVVELLPSRLAAQICLRYSHPQIQIQLVSLYGLTLHKIKKLSIPVLETTHVYNERYDSDSDPSLKPSEEKPSPRSTNHSTHSHLFQRCMKVKKHEAPCTARRYQPGERREEISGCGWKIDSPWKKKSKLVTHFFRLTENAFSYWGRESFGETIFPCSRLCSRNQWQ